MKEKTFLARGIFAGICISMGGCIYLKLGGVVGAILFAFGLIAVVSLGLNLFTGKAQFVWGRGAADTTAPGGYTWLFSILVLNIVGCILMAALFSSASMQESAMAIIEKRLDSSPIRNGLLAIGCGFIMTLAVQGAAKGKWLPLLFGIPAFILCGFPHCVADAFYIASLPLDYISEEIVDLLLFYVAIVIGNFLGCNAYRAFKQPEAVMQPTEIKSAETEKS